MRIARPSLFRALLSFLFAAAVLTNSIAEAAPEKPAATGGESVASPQLVLWIATNGADVNPGTREKPFATLEHARDTIRELKQRNGLPAGGVTVYLRGGTYPRQNTFALRREDSGTLSAPIIYASASNEVATLFGGTPLLRDWFTPVTDPAVLERVISISARQNLVQCNLKAHNIADYGELSAHGYGKAASGKTAPVMLYVGGQRMTLARWPNPDQHFPQMLNRYDRGRRGVVARSGIIDPGPDDKDPDYLRRGGTFSYAFDRPALWTNNNDIWLDGVFSWTWEWSYNKVAQIDPVKKQITLRYGESSGIVDEYAGNFFFAGNLLEEIDQPGEYYLDRQKGILYLLPPEQFHSGTPIQLNTLAVPMLEVRDASDIKFNGLEFSFGRNDGFLLANCQRVQLEHCEIGNFAGKGGSLFGKSCAVSACRIHDIGGAGIDVNGGNLKTLEAADNRVEDCDIHDWAWYNRVYSPAISLGGVGQLALHNRIHQGPHLGIAVSGNDHRIEYNDFSEVCREFIDMGVIYINVGTRPLERGWIIRRNCFHDIAATADSPINVACVYIDHGSQGGLVEENVFYRIGHPANGSLVHAIIVSGIHTTIRHNLFIDCTDACRLAAKEMPADYLADRYKNYRWANYFRQFDLATAPQVKKYPEVASLLPGAAPMTKEQMWNLFDGNVIWNPAVKRTKPEGLVIEDKDPQKTPIIPLTETANWRSDVDPGFVAAASQNFSLRPDAEVFKRIPGFPKIPFDLIGPRQPAGPLHRLQNKGTLAESPGSTAAKE